MTSMDRHFPNPTSGRAEAINARSGDPLPQLLTQILERAIMPATVTRSVSRPWASALFEGRRHMISLRLDGADAAARHARFADGLGSAEWRLRGHFVADIVIDESRSEPDAEYLELSALTIEEW